MLAVSPLSKADGFSDELLGGGLDPMLEDIDLEDLFFGFDGVDMLPDLVGDADEIFADFSAARGCGEDDMGTVAKAMEVSSTTGGFCEGKDLSSSSSSFEKREEEEDVGKNLSKEKEAPIATTSTANSPSLKMDKGGRKVAAASKSKATQAKRKVTKKVDWTPELHRKFVQAVEQIGLDKAVPSRILELMGIDCLTRYNIASHLQKYRSHRKHLLAREVETASWRKRQQIYSNAAAAAAAAPGAAAAKKDTSPWLAPTMAFPTHPPPVQHYRPLHVWGHPPMDPNLVHLWPKHLHHRPAMPWPALPPPPTSWPSHYSRGPNALTGHGMPCFYPPMPSTVSFASPSAVPGIPPHPLYRPDSAVGMKMNRLLPVSPLQPFEAHPSKESIDAAIGDVLAKPWSPLPLGLKPPSVESVTTELQKQGISKIPPTT